MAFQALDGIFIQSIGLMKKSTCILLVSVCCLFAFASQAQDDTAAIRSVIEKESTSYFALDHAAWETNWLKVPYAYWSYSDSTGCSIVEGSDNIEKNFKEYFLTAKPSKSKIERVWQEVRVYGKGAYVKFTQKVSDDFDHDETSETRIMEKDKDGKWKIVVLIAIAKYPN